MADLTLSEAATQYIESLRGDKALSTQTDVGRFLRWYGPERRLKELRGHDVSLYGESLGPATPETRRRADAVRGLLAFLKKEGLLEANLAPHLRLRKNTKSATGRAGGKEEQAVELTQEGIQTLEGELESLKGQRLEVREEIRRAMLDKDFRENAPLDAAKEKQGHIEARIREIEGVLKRAVVASMKSGGALVDVGSTVIVRNLRMGALTRYTIVGPTEANASDGKISSDSPVGKALLGRGVGEEVAIDVPAGAIRLVIEKLEE